MAQIDTGGGTSAGTGSHSGGGGSNGNYGTTSGFGGGNDIPSAHTAGEISDGLQNFINASINHSNETDANDPTQSGSSSGMVEIISDDGDTYTVENVSSGQIISGVYDASGGAFTRNVGDYADMFAACGIQYIGWVLQPCRDVEDWDKEKENTEDDDENYLEEWEDNDIQSGEEPQNPGTVTAIA